MDTYEKECFIMLKSDLHATDFVICMGGYKGVRPRYKHIMNRPHYMRDKNYRGKDAFNDKTRIIFGCIKDGLFHYVDD